MAFMTVASLPGYEVKELGTDHDFAEFIRTASVEELAQERDRMETFVEGFRNVRTFVSEEVRARLHMLQEAIELDDLVSSWMV